MNNRTLTLNTEKIRACIDACLECAITCENCFTACLHESNVQNMTHCMQLDRDCAEICMTTARFLMRGSGHGIHLLKECEELCRACATECDKHDMEHCRNCAEACRKCQDVCEHLQREDMSSLVDF